MYIMATIANRKTVSFKLIILRANFILKYTLVIQLCFKKSVNRLSGASYLSQDPSNRFRIQLLFEPGC